MRDRPAFLSQLDPYLRRGACVCTRASRTPPTPEGYEFALPVCPYRSSKLQSSVDSSTVCPRRGQALRGDHRLGQEAAARAKVMKSPSRHDKAGPRIHDLIGLSVAAALLMLTTLPIDDRSVSALERDAFRSLNELPGVIFPGVWAVMQSEIFAHTNGRNDCASLSPLSSRHGRSAGRIARVVTR